MGRTYHFSATIPFAVNPRIYSRPLPTSPKFAADATASRESKNGEYFTACPAKPCVRNSSIVVDALLLFGFVDVVGVVSQMFVR